MMKKRYFKPLVNELLPDHYRWKIDSDGNYHLVHRIFKKYGIPPESDNHAQQAIDLKKVPRLSRYIDNHRDEIFTFSTVYEPFQLKKLRKRLIDDNFICDDITENQFCYIFTEQLLPDYIKPIKWKIRWGAKESLRYFLELLIPGVILHKNQIAKCFVDIDNNPMTISKPNRKKGIRHDIKIRLQKIIYSI